MSRDETPDLMDDMLGPSDSGKFTPKPKPVKIQKVKRTFYFNPSIVGKYEELEFKMRRATGEIIDKSDIVEAAILLAYAEFEENGEASEFVKYIHQVK